MSKVFEENAQKAISLSEGLKKHYSEVSKKLIAANAALDAVKEKAMMYRKLIKTHYSPEQWIRFGIQDKR